VTKSGKQRSLSTENANILVYQYRVKVRQYKTHAYAH